MTFSGRPVVGGSLADGVYDLTVSGAKVHAGSATGPAMAADFAAEFHRLYSDADGDGDGDNAGAGTVQVRLAQANGTFGPATALAVRGPNTVGPSSVLLADLNADNKLDVVATVGSAAAAAAAAVAGLHTFFDCVSA